MRRSSFSILKFNLVSVLLALVWAGSDQLLSAADDTYALTNASNDLLVNGSAPTAVTSGQVKIGGGQLVTSGGIGIGGPASLNGKLSLNGAIATNRLLTILESGTERAYLGVGMDNVLRVETLNAASLALNTNALDRVLVDGIGNVGIGGASGGDKLDVFGSTRFRANTAVVVPSGADGNMSVTVSGTCAVAMGFNGTAATNGFGAPSGTAYLGCANGWPMALTTVGIERMRLDGAGNVGIGTPSPTTFGSGGNPTILQVHGTAPGIPYGLLELTTSSAVVGNPLGQIDFGSPTKGRTAVINSVCTNTTSLGGYLSFYTTTAGTLSQRMVITDIGNVGIGVAAPTSALAVNGVISAKELKVVASPADYVFADGYRLRPLAEVEAFITAHKHLPGVPSAKEQEEQGEMVADLMRAHLEKIEELNLYVIQQQKVIDALMAQQKAAAETMQRQDAVLVLVLGKLTAIQAGHSSSIPVAP